MRHHLRPRVSLPFASLLLALAAGCATSPAIEAPLRYPGFDGYERAVRTDSPVAQEWFDQGIQLLYGFNHDEAIRSFQAALELDPDCLMAWWGIAYAAGVDINNPDMTEEEQKLAVEAAGEAMRCAALPGADPVEATLAEAVSRRYVYPFPEDRKHLDEAYAAAMARASALAPDDLDVGTVYADALMNLQPWDLWTKDGDPKGRTPEIVAALEHVIALAPKHPGANHFLIHTLEASPDPSRAEAAADRLQALVPGSGHLVHMPSHIYVRVGRYADASDANQRAIDADRAYFKLAPPPGFYSLYFVHNIHMLAFAAMMEGRYETSMAAARALDEEVPADFLRDYVGFADGLMATPLHVMIRFGRWEDILAEPEPAEFRLMSRAMRHYARGVALSALGRVEEARAEQELFEASAAAVPEDWTVGNNSASEVLSLARHMLRGELLYREGRLDEAFEALRAGVQLEDALVYDEPPGWMQPIRHALGALLLGADRAAEAEAVYRQDLIEHPGNGWALLGLENALTQQGRSGETAPLRAERSVVWRRADVTPSSSCYCEPGGPATGLR